MQITSNSPSTKDDCHWCGGTEDKKLLILVRLLYVLLQVAYLRISEDEPSRLADMPSLITNYASGLLEGTYPLSG